MEPFEHVIKAMDQLPRKMYPLFKFCVQFWVGSSWTLWDVYGSQV